MCTPSGARATVAFTAWRWKSARRQLSLAEPLAGDHGTTGQQHSSLSRHRCHRAVLQPLGQDPHARAVSAQISGGASSGSVAPSVGGPGMGAGTGHRPSCPLAPLSPPGGLGQGLPFASKTHRQAAGHGTELGGGHGACAVDCMWADLVGVVIDRMHLTSENTFSFSALVLCFSLLEMIKFSFWPACPFRSTT
nr:unnamed protein product [Callosobruchus chinensis]